MELYFLDESAPGLKAWLTDRGGYLFEERPDAARSAAIGLNAACADEWQDRQEQLAH